MKELPTYQSLVDSFAKLPGIGNKTAERLAFSVLEMKEEDAKQFAEAILNAKSKVTQRLPWRLPCLGRLALALERDRRKRASN